MNSWIVATVIVLGTTILIYAIICAVSNAVYSYDDYIRKQEEIEKHKDYDVEFVEEEDVPINNNCCNCGAPVNSNRFACPYCNTPYIYGVDLSRVGDMALKRPDPTDIDYPHSRYRRKRLEQ